MKRVVLNGLYILLTLAFLSCSKTPTDALNNLKSNYYRGNIENTKSYFTKGTIEAMKEMEKLLLGIMDKEMTSDNRFIEGAEWEIISEEIVGDRASVRVKYIEHPVENMKGFQHIFLMKIEDNVWKLDMEEELKTSCSMIKQMKGTTDLTKKNKIRQK